ncbi:hypothetical protein CM1200mP19_1950 [bacterium]|nr:MAG: hypothetical protein CM1200mP19_1950 [bacterium]
MNSGVNVLGQGNRANLTIGRAVQLAVRNVGGGQPGGIDRATHGNPPNSLLLRRGRSGSPWTTLAEDPGFDRSTHVVNAFCGEAPRIPVDQQSRSADSLLRSLASGLLSAVSPERSSAWTACSCSHLSTWPLSATRDGIGPGLWTIGTYLMVESNDILLGPWNRGRAPGIDGWPALPKFRPDGLLVVHAGGPAGLFSAIVGGG